MIKQLVKSIHNRGQKEHFGWDSVEHSARNTLQVTEIERLKTSL